jgi:hypothetical protein
MNLLNLTRLAEPFDEVLAQEGFELKRSQEPAWAGVRTAYFQREGIQVVYTFSLEESTNEMFRIPLSKKYLIIIDYDILQEGEIFKGGISESNIKQENLEKELGILAEQNFKREIDRYFQSQNE